MTDWTKTRKFKDGDRVCFKNELDVMIIKSLCLDETSKQDFNKGIGFFYEMTDSIIFNESLLVLEKDCIEESIKKNEIEIAKHKRSLAKKIKDDKERILKGLEPEFEGVSIKFKDGSVRLFGSWQEWCQQSAFSEYVIVTRSITKDEIKDAILVKQKENDDLKKRLKANTINK